MRLREMRDLPICVGEVQVEFEKDCLPCMVPERSLIRLDNHPGNEFIALFGRQQFAFWRISHGGTAASYWYGGIADNKPFLVQIEEQVYQELILGGEPAFFAAMKPPVIRGLEMLLSTKAALHGEIYSNLLPLAITDEDILNLIGFLWGCSSQLLGNGEESMDILGTSQRLRGAYLKPAQGDFIISRGTLLEPCPFHLVTPHVLARRIGIILHHQQ